jgi:tRNA (guanine-N(7)-)-methyltransferase subunit TRM82
MRHPFQCITAIYPSSSQNAYLLAACGPKLLSTCLRTGDIKSQWTPEDLKDPSILSNPGDGHLDNERPAKRLKGSNLTTNAPNIIRIAASPNGDHAVIVTDDKCVRVFAVSSEGALDEMSQRTMPKRPCAIQVLPDNATILCGDKFGDVYQLPLLPIAKDEDSPNEPRETSQQAPQPFKPSATTATVHTKRNLKALEAQQKQKNLTPKLKEPLAFEHKLLLGHVSMLTDLVYADQEVDGKHRGYIITADRDEHIRVSRGSPQSHVIEGYCLGHTEFVSKICAIPGTNFLVSGGGDDTICAWEWPSFRLKSKFGSFQRRVRDTSNANSSPDQPETEYLAVSGIWTAKAQMEARCGEAESYQGSESVVVVAWEKTPVLGYCRVTDLLQSSSDPEWQLECFDAPILDLAPSGDVLYLSFDTREDSHGRLEACVLEMKYREGRTVVSTCERSLSHPLEDLNSVKVEAADDKSIDSLLYGIANLRKRGRGDEEVEDEG